MFTNGHTHSLLTCPQLGEVSVNLPATDLYPYFFFFIFIFSTIHSILLNPSVKRSFLCFGLSLSSQREPREASCEPCSEICPLIFQPADSILLFPSSDSETHHHIFRDLTGVRLSF